MPDYHRRVALYWCGVVGLGALALAGCLLQMAAAGAQAWLHVAIAAGLAMAAGLFPVRVPGTRQAYVAGEIFIVLVLLMHGAPAAALVAAAEAAVAAWRASGRWTSRLVSPATAACAMVAAGALLGPALQQAKQGDSAAELLGASMAFAALYFLLNAQLVIGLQRLKRREAFFQWFDLLSVFRWVGLAYAGSASVAALLFVLHREQGPAVLASMLPLLALLLVTLHFYFRDQESRLALQAANDSAAVREAVLAEREAAARARRLRDLQASERRFQSAFTHAAIGMALLDFDGRMLLANRALAQLLGVDERALVQRPFQDFIAVEDRPRFDEPLGLVGGAAFTPFTRELRCYAADGSLCWLALHCAHFDEPGPGEDQSRPCLILQAQDVSERRRAEAGLAALAFHDPLTGLPNRRRFNECLHSAVSRFQADPTHPWAVMFIDFDRFKLVNDSLGHDAGDELLRQVARRVQEKLRPADIVARLGGDEFAILAERIEHERDAIVLAERLMEALRRPFVLPTAQGPTEIVASASIGITFSALGYDSAEAVLRDADTAMYKAKGAGRARFAVFDAGLHTAVSQRLRLEGELRQAIERGQLAVAYQPVFELAEPPRLTGFEALLRWQHPQSGELLPGDFLPVAETAEEGGLMLKLTDFVLHVACRQLRQWQTAGPQSAALTMSINLSAGDLANPALVARVTQAIVEAGIRPEDLTLELTENVLMSNLDAARGALSELRTLGVQLAVDDFGAGSSSLAHLSKLPIDGFKIDGGFVAELRPGGADAAVVRAIVMLGRTLAKAVVAEGIETDAQLVQLRELGCALGQGFALARPMTGDAATAWLLHR